MEDVDFGLKRPDTLHIEIVYKVLRVIGEVDICPRPPALIQAEVGDVIVPKY